MTKPNETPLNSSESNGRPSRWPDIAKTIVLALVALASLGTAVFLIWFSYTGAVPGPREGLYKDIITFILSLIGSIIVGHWYARLSNIEKVDTIAERSTEKMVLLSIQLEELRTYLEDSIAVAKKSEHSMIGALLAYRHRTEAAAHLISSLASSNETYRGDWLGVVSNPMKSTIEQKHAKLRQYFDAIHTLRERGAFRQAPSLEDANSVQPEIAAAQQTIEQIRKDLPIPQFTPPVPKPPAVSVQQTPFAQASESSQEGEMSIEVIRGVFIVVGTGKLVPRMQSKPFVSIEHLASPDGTLPGSIKTSVGVGTNFDFNIKIAAVELNKALPLGVYKFRYSAKAVPPGATLHGAPG